MGPALALGCGEAGDENGSVEHVETLSLSAAP
jgi:hypothetical protein